MSNSLYELDFCYNRLVKNLSYGVNPTKLLNELLYNNNLYPLIILYNKSMYGNSEVISYNDLIEKYYIIHSKLNKIFLKLKRYGAILDINILYNTLQYINEQQGNDLYIDNNNFEIEIKKSHDIGIIIDILSKFYTIDIEIYRNIHTISYNDNNTKYLYKNKTFKYVLLSNIKFHSKYIQEKLDELAIVGGLIIFDNWNQFFYMFNYLKNGSDIDYYQFIYTTPEFYSSFYSTIKYILDTKHRYNNNIYVFDNFVQEGYDKFIYHICNYHDDLLLHDDVINLEADDLYINYSNIINLFNYYNTKPNIKSIFDNVTIDFMLNENISVYQQKTILFNCVYQIYIHNLVSLQYINDNKLLNVITYNNDQHINTIIKDYYQYDILKDLKQYSIKNLTYNY